MQNFLIPSRSLDKIKIYKLICPDTKNVIYVGQTDYDNLLFRLIGHLTNLRRVGKNNTKNKIFLNYLEQGKIPKIELIEEVDKKEGLNREKYWINFYSKKFDILNITYNPEKQHLKNNHLCKKVYQYDLDGNFIKEWESNKEASQILNISSNSIYGSCINVNRIAGQYQWRYFYKKKIRSHSYNRIPAKEISVYSLDGKLLKTFESAFEAAEKLNLKVRAIYKALSGEIKTHADYRFNYGREKELPGILPRSRRLGKCNKNL
jgi:hypothetical protein